MTATGHLGAIPDLQKLFNDGSHIPYWWVGEGILKMEFGDQRKGLCSEDILHTSAKAKKRFFNQSSLVFRLARADGSWKETNIKLFKNGGFQMTGISSTEMGRAALTRLIALNAGRGIWASEPWIKTFEVQMMNSDYNVGKAIRRDRLYTILVENYGLWSTFEPTIYQGVNTKFFWNKARPATAPPGICVCPEPCEGDGDGYSVGHCKKITISPFRTGSIIITGARHPEQLEDAYQFMNGVLSKHAEEVLRDEAAPAATAATPPRKVAPAPTTAEGCIRNRMRASPRNIVRLS
jgi:TATA-box binding protein (TBP) (component of TFIID and TFIIIB)